MGVLYTYGHGTCMTQENKPPSIFGAMTGKAMPAAVARLANVSNHA